jgi:hypothetical protein
VSDSGDEARAFLNTLINVHRVVGKPKGGQLAEFPPLAYGGQDEAATLDELSFHDPRDYRGRPSVVDALVWTETLRDVDLASMAAALDRRTPLASPEVVKVRAQLVSVLMPGAIIDGGSARLLGEILDVVTGAVLALDANPLPLRELPTPAYFPYPDPDAGTVQVVARALHLAQGRLARHGDRGSSRDFDPASVPHGAAVAGDGLHDTLGVEIFQDGRRNAPSRRD